MSNDFKNISMPASREPVSLLAVDRAISELRRGQIIAVYGGGGTAILTQAAEAATPESLKKLTRISQSEPILAITARRAAVLKLANSTAKIICLKAKDTLSAEIIHDIANPLSCLPHERLNSIAKLVVVDTVAHGCDNAAVKLTKLARLLPAAITAHIGNPEANDLAAWTARHDMLMVDAGDIFQYEHTATRTLHAISEARVPLFDAENTRIIAFRPIDGGLEHLAIIIGEPTTLKTDAVLTRIHSECFTGDLLGSLRCDCGDQLRGAIKEISRANGGVLLYLAQEGRGIGLVNKLRAYELQDQGHDTIEANEQLGFDADERIYLPAAQMLQQLGFLRIRLMTNNPDKVTALSQCGVDIAERVAHTFPANAHNETYLRTKAGRGGHLF